MGFDEEVGEVVVGWEVDEGGRRNNGSRRR